MERLEASRTFYVNVGIRVQVGGRGDCIFYSWVVLLGIDLIALVVENGRVPLDDGSAHAGVLNCLSALASATWELRKGVGDAHLFVGARPRGGNELSFPGESRPLLQFVAAVAIVFDFGIRVRLWPSKPDQYSGQR